MWLWGADDTLGPMTNDEDDWKLTRRILEGESAAFATLVERHEQTVLAIVSRRIPAGERREVTHETFVRAYRSLRGFRGEQPFEHWLSKIAVRHCYDFWRKRYRSRERSESELSNDEREWLRSAASSSEQSRFLSEEERKHAASVLERALEELGAETRAVIELVHLEGRTIRDAAELLGWTAVNVKVRAHRGRKQLREILTRMYREEDA